MHIKKCVVRLRVWLIFTSRYIYCDVKEIHNLFVCFDSNFQTMVVVNKAHRSLSISSIWLVALIIPKLSLKIQVYKFQKELFNDVIKIYKSNMLFIPAGLRIKQLTGYKMNPKTYNDLLQ
jgi:hypothetical protein